MEAFSTPKRFSLLDAYAGTLDSVVTASQFSVAVGFASDIFCTRVSVKVVQLAIGAVHLRWV
jgi:hypothetical protein